MNDIFAFTDYRSFLKAHAEDRKLKQKGWSYGAWAKRLRLGGTASLTMVVNGQRRPGPKLTKQLAEYFGFNERQSRYFFDLVQLEKVERDPHLKVLVMEELKRLSPKKSFQLLDERTFGLISGWYFYAIRQACRMSDPILDVEGLRERLLFPVDTRKVRAAVSTMLDLGLLAKDDAGRIHATGQALSTSDDVASEAIRRFHEEILRLAHESVRRFSIEERELRALTLCVDSARLPEMQKRVREFIEEMSRDFAAEGDAVYQLAVQLFPLAKSKTKKKTQ